MLRIPEPKETVFPFPLSFSCIFAHGADGLFSGSGRLGLPLGTGARLATATTIVMPKVTWHPRISALRTIRHRRTILADEMPLSAFRVSTIRLAASTITG